MRSERSDAMQAGLTAALKAYAAEGGFHLVGITSPDPFPEAELDITRWLGEGHQGEMAWLNEARTRLATRPQELLPGARSLVVVGVSYRTVEPAAGPGGRVARYDASKRARPSGWPEFEPRLGTRLDRDGVL